MSNLTNPVIAQLQHRQKLRSDLEYWCEHALKPFEQTPAKHHKILIQALQDESIKRLMIFMPPGSAKALALDTPIPTPDGWKNMGDLQVGDKVFDENGYPCNVTWVSPIHRNRPVFRVLTDCGDEIIADHDHEWLVRLSNKPRKALKQSGKHHATLKNRDDPMSHFKLKETHELVRKRSKRPMIMRAKPLLLPEQILPIDPWMLGVWLGNGTSADGSVTVGLHDRDWQQAEAARLGYTVKQHKHPMHYGVQDIRRHLVTLNLLNNKHIPDVYLRASIEQRIALLQGLIDTDGTVCPDGGMVTFCNTNKRLAENVRELVRSLGRKAGWGERRAMLNGKDCGPAYYVSFYHGEGARVPRKANLCRDQYRTPNTYIDVEPAGTADTVCIEVDSPSHLFLCGKSMTPTHNSTYASVLFPPWYISHNKNKNIIAVSHSASLAEEFSGKIRSFIAENSTDLGFEIMQGSNSRENWKTTNGCTYKAVGAGGAITGVRADLLLADDILKGSEAADSPTARDKLYNFYRSDAYTRLKKGGRIIIIMTRWHQDDLAGRLLQAAHEDWHVIKMPALCVDETNDPLGRALGEPLWADWQPLETLEKIRATVGERNWQSLYQQNPILSEYALIDVKKLREETDEPTGGSWCRAWDIAATETYSHPNPDWTVGTLLHRSKEGRFTIVDVVRFRGEPHTVQNTILETARKDGKGVHIAIPQDSGAAGKYMARDFVRLLAGYSVETIAQGSASKLTKANAMISQINGANVSIMSRPWTRTFTEELSVFPQGTHDDIVDSCAMGFNFLIAKNRQHLAFARFDYMER